jgi:hypothetical protein
MILGCERWLLHALLVRIGRQDIIFDGWHRSRRLSIGFLRGGRCLIRGLVLFGGPFWDVAAGKRARDADFYVQQFDNTLLYVWCI